MKLEPVYVVAPMPQPPSMPSRRAFLLIGSAFVGGAVLGGACGVAIGKTAAADAGAGDPLLAWLRMLADERTPIGELTTNAQRYLLHLDTTYPDDELLWQGAVRMARAVADDQALPDRRLLGRLLVRLFEAHDRMLLVDTDLLAQLRAIR